MLKMLDYVKMANTRLSENLDRASELVSPLVDAYRASNCKVVRTGPSVSRSPSHRGGLFVSFVMSSKQLMASKVPQIL